MALFPKRGVDTSLPKSDRGFASLDDFDFRLMPKNARVTLTLADSDSHQDELRKIVESGEHESAETAVSPRSMADERVDAPIPVRLFLGRRVSGVVGMIPRGFESLFDENVRRIDDRTGKTRIPVRIDHKKGAYRVVLLLGKTR
jgi:hypothetical protein